MSPMADVSLHFDFISRFIDAADFITITIIE